MAVTKIRKISSWTLLVLLVVSVAVCLAFFVGGVELDAAGNKVYANTDLVLYWGYTLVALTLIATIVFAIISLIQGFRTNPKRALQSLLVFILLIVILAITYAMAPRCLSTRTQHNTTLQGGLRPSTCVSTPLIRSSLSSSRVSSGVVSASVLPSK